MYIRFKPKDLLSKADYKEYLKRYKHIGCIDDRGRILLPKKMMSQVDDYKLIEISFGKNQNQIIIDFITPQLLQGDEL